MVYVDDAGHSNAQSKKISYKSKTEIACEVCSRGMMYVRTEVINKTTSTITQQLECPVCSEGYPRVVESDRKTVVSSPFTDTKNLR